MKVQRLTDDVEECGQFHSGAGRYGRAGIFSRLPRALILPVILSLAMAAAACGDSEPTDPPLTPLPAAPAPAADSAPDSEASSPPTPISAAAAGAAATAAPAPIPTSSPDPVLTVAHTTSLTNTPTPTPILFPYTVTDSNGNEVTFEEPPERIVAFDAAAVETLFAIGEDHRVVATHSFVFFPDEVAEIPKVGDAFNMNIEATVALEPDLVFVFSPAFLEQLEAVGLRVLYTQSLSDDFIKTADAIRMWGGIVGNPVAAESLAVEFESRVESIAEIMSAYESGPSIFQDVGGLWTPGPGTLVGEVFDLLKLRNIAHDVSGYAQLSPEVIVERNPQIIITGESKSFTDNSAFQNVLAVRNGHIFELQSTRLSIAGPRFVEGIEELARLVYPGIFGQQE